jgi:hypothetical protein
MCRTTRDATGTLYAGVIDAIDHASRNSARPEACVVRFHGNDTVLPVLQVKLLEELVPLEDANFAAQVSTID